MYFQFPNRFFVTGTDTGIGKTLISAMLCLGLDSNYWKPVQSGIEDGTDSSWLNSVGIKPEKILAETYKLNTPVSPHLAAQIDGLSIDMDKFVLPDSICVPKLIVEGAGGIMVPLNEQHMVIDLIQQLELPTLIVARSGLGTINHTVLTIKMLRARRIGILGVVMNGEINEANKKALEHYGQVKVIAQVPVLNEVNQATLINAFHQYFARGNKHEPSSGILDMAPIYPDENSVAGAQSEVRIGHLSST